MSWASCTEGHTSVRVNFLLTVAVAHGCTAAACATPSSTRTSRRPVMGVDAPLKGPLVSNVAPHALAPCATSEAARSVANQVPDCLLHLSRTGKEESDETKLRLVTRGGKSREQRLHTHTSGSQVACTHREGRRTTVLHKVRSRISNGQTNSSRHRASTNTPGCLRPPHILSHPSARILAVGLLVISL
eukprot:scaffold72758_cov22-Tisochrysis_lutea.AAC.1